MELLGHILSAGYLIYLYKEGKYALRTLGKLIELFAQTGICIKYALVPCFYIDLVPIFLRKMHYQN